MEPTKKPWYVRKSESYKISRPVNSSKAHQGFRTRSLGATHSRVSLNSTGSYGSISGGRYVSRSGTRSSGLGPSLEGSLYSERSMQSSDSLYSSTANDIDRPPGVYRTRSIEELLDKYAPLPIPKKGRQDKSTGSLDRLTSGKERIKFAIAYSSAKVGASPVLSPNRVSNVDSGESTSSIFVSKPSVTTEDVVEDVFSIDDGNNVLNLEGYGASVTESSTDIDTEAYTSAYYSQPVSVPYVGNALESEIPVKRPSPLNFDLLGSSEGVSVSPRDASYPDLESPMRTRRSPIASPVRTRSPIASPVRTRSPIASPVRTRSPISSPVRTRRSPSGSVRSYVRNQKSQSSQPRSPTGTVISRISQPRSPTGSIRSPSRSPTGTKRAFDIQNWSPTSSIRSCSSHSRSPTGSTRSQGSQTRSPTHSQQKYPTKSLEFQTASVTEAARPHFIHSWSPDIFQTIVDPSKTCNIDYNLSSSHSSSIPSQRSSFLNKYSSASEFAPIHTKLSQNVIIPSPDSNSSQWAPVSSFHNQARRRSSASLDTATDKYIDILGSDCHEEYISTDYLELNISPIGRESPSSPCRDIKIIKTNTPRSSPPLLKDKSHDVIQSKSSVFTKELPDDLIRETSNLLSPMTRERNESGGSDSAIDMDGSSGDENKLIWQSPSSRPEHFVADRIFSNDMRSSATNADETSPCTHESSIGDSSSVFRCISMSEIHQSPLENTDHVRTDSQDSSTSIKQQDRPLSPRIPFSKVQTPSFTKIIHPPPSVVISDHSHDDLPSPKTPDDIKDSKVFSEVEQVADSLTSKKGYISLTRSLSDLSSKSDINLDPTYNADRRSSERRLSFSSTTSERSDSIKSGLSDSSYSIDDEDLDFMPHRRKLSAPVSEAPILFTVSCIRTRLTKDSTSEGVRRQQDVFGGFPLAQENLGKSFPVGEKSENFSILKERQEIFGHSGEIRSEKKL